MKNLGSRLLKALLAITLAEIVSVSLGSTMAAHLPILGIIATIASGIVMGILLSVKFKISGGDFMTVITLSLFGSLALFYTADGLAQILAGEKAPNILVSETPLHPNASVFHFRDAVVLKKMHSMHIAYGRKHTSLYYFAAPIVSSHWTKTDKVTAWAVCNHSLKSCNWDKNYQDAVIIGSLEREDYQKAIESTRKKYHLNCDPNAPILRMVPNSEAEMKVRIIVSGITYGVVSGLCIIAVAISVFFTRKKGE